MCFFFQHLRLLPKVRFLQTDICRPTEPRKSFEKTIPPPIHQQASVDFAKVKKDADELVILSQSIHSGIDDVGKGMLPKDLIDKLKQLEKLSKRLRSQLTP